MHSQNVNLWETKEGKAWDVPYENKKKNNNDGRYEVLERELSQKRASDRKKLRREELELKKQRREKCKKNIENP